jgi:acyl-CoA thioesterase-1
MKRELDMFIKDNATVLFQGDSITDWGRDYSDPNDLGSGYPLKIAQYFSIFLNHKNVKFLNRGISGNRAIELKARWQQDCIDINPDYVSILIGINDCWRRYDSNDITTADEYENNYRYILNEVKTKTNAEIIILEPYVLPTLADRITWREDLDPKIQKARQLASEFNALYIPLDGLFAAQAANIKPELLASDGVHPTDKGHALIAKAWIESVT